MDLSGDVIEEGALNEALIGGGIDHFGGHADDFADVVKGDGDAWRLSSHDLCTFDGQLRLQCVTIAHFYDVYFMVSTRSVLIGFVIRLVRVRRMDVRVVI
jgi:hypothetical protein